MKWDFRPDVIESQLAHQERSMTAHPTIGLSIYKSAAR